MAIDSTDTTDTNVGAASQPLKRVKSVVIADPVDSSPVSQDPPSNQHHEVHLLDEGSNDSVVWPINRCCYEELRPVELATVEQLFASRDDTPLFMKWVVVHKAPRTFQKRLLVISSFRLWMLKHRRSPFKSSLVVSKELQLLHMDRITVLLLRTLQLSDPTAISTSITLQFHTATKHQSHVHTDGDAESTRDATRQLHFDPGVNAESIVRLLQRELHEMRLVFPGQRLPHLSMPSTCHWQEFFTLRESSKSTGSGDSSRKAWGDAMTTAYRCFCDDLGVHYRASVTTRLRECLASTCVDFPYCLSAASSSTTFAAPVIPSHADSAGSGGLVGLLSMIAGTLGLSKSAALAKEMLALARTLEHTPCFEDIVVYDLPVHEQVLTALFHTLLSPGQHSSTRSAVKGFALTNVNLSSRALRTLQHIVLQATIKRSANTPALQLRRLDLSFNRFSVLMASGLATMLELLPNGLEILQLEQCHLNMLSSSRILAAMKSSHGFSAGLRELNLSGNTLAIEGTRMLAMWITGAFALKRLDLSRTRLQTNLFFQSFKQNTILHESSLVALDLSYNRMGTQASYDLGDILGKTQSLSTIVLRGMKQTLLHPRRLLNDVLQAKHKRRKQVKNTLKMTPPVCHGLRKVHLKNILGPMLQNSTRLFPCMIDLSENDLRGPKATVLAHLLDSAPNAAHASLRVDYAQLHDKAAVLLLHSLRGCKTLESLSLEGNGFVQRRTKQSYKRFHSQRSKATMAVPLPSVLEQAAGDALALLLGGTTSQPAQSDGSSGDSAHSFTHLYHHRPKRLTLKELSLRAQGNFLFGPHVLTTAIQALAVNASLIMLDVSGNECGDRLAAALGAALPANKTLQVLYWDDNFTTVDGFFQFYEGLLKNQTLSVVQLPINDTRRILEEQKDPPREKLFSVLGKIFKVTERNQTVAAGTKHQRHANRRAASPTKTAAARAAYPIDESRKESGGKDDNQAEGEHPESKDEEKASAEAITPTLPVETTSTVIEHAQPKHRRRAVEHKEESWAPYYSASSRYPTTIKNWSQSPNGNEDLRASWDQIGSLASMLT